MAKAKKTAKKKPAKKTKAQLAKIRAAAGRKAARTRKANHAKHVKAGKKGAAKKGGAKKGGAKKGSKRVSAGLTQRVSRLEIRVGGIQKEVTKLSARTFGMGHPMRISARPLGKLPMSSLRPVHRSVTLPSAMPLHVRSVGSMPMHPQHGGPWSFPTPTRANPTKRRRSTKRRAAKRSRR